MIPGYAFAVVVSILLVVFLVVLLRTRRLREKYAITWILLGVAICVLGAFPGAIGALSDAVGVQTPSNLLFALALVVLLVVCVQLSVEITALEEETRTIVEEVALLRFEFEEERDARAVTTAGAVEAPVAEPALPPVERVAEPAVERAVKPVVEPVPDVRQAPAER